MKRGLLWISMFLITVILVACGGNEEMSTETEASENNNRDSNEEMTLRLGHVNSEENIYHIASEKFAELASEYSNGSINFELYPGGQLGGEREMLESVQSGTLDAGYISLAYFENFTPIFTGFQMPFMIDDYETGYKAITSDTAEKTLQALEEFNIKGLAIVQTGMRKLGNNVKPIKTIEDFEGLKLRAPEAGLHLDMYKALGASPTPVAFPEIYTSMQTGVLEGTDQLLATHVADNFIEVFDYLSETKFYPWPAIIALSLDTYESLSADQQEALKQAAVDTQAFIYENVEKYEEEALEKIKQTDIQIDPSLDVEELRKKVQPVIDKYTEMDPLIKETVETIKEIQGQ